MDFPSRDHEYARGPIVRSALDVIDHLLSLACGRGAEPNEPEGVCVVS